MALLNIFAHQPKPLEGLKSYETMTEEEIRKSLKEICDRICKEVTSLKKISDAVKEELGYPEEPLVGATPRGAMVTIEGPQKGTIFYEFKTKKDLTPKEFIPEELESNN